VILWLKKKLKGISLLGTVSSLTSSLNSINRIQKSNYNTLTYMIKPKLVSSKLYSTFNHLNFSPAVVYSKADLDKLKILNENKNKSGVYI